MTKRKKRNRGKAEKEEHTVPNTAANRQRNLRRKLSKNVRKMIQSIGPGPGRIGAENGQNYEGSIWEAESLVGTKQDSDQKKKVKLP